MAVSSLDGGDTAWVLMSTALVMMMLLPGLALFYGGLVRAKNLLSVMSQVLGITALAIIVWLLWGYSLAFDGGGAWIGSLAKAGLAGVGPDSLWPTSGGHAIPELAFVAFQMSFAAITAALVIGALVERVRFGAILLFTGLWLTLVYVPIAHMVWAAEGWIFKLGAIDFAGGTVVHVNAGIAALVGVLFAGPRLGHLKEAMPPHSLALTMVGAGLLWVGWFGFNAGSALGANGSAAVALVNTLAAPAAGILAWMGIERWVSGKPSMLGGASGAVAGLVAITPAAGIAGPLGAMLLGRRRQPGVLRLRRLAQEPPALRRQPRRVRNPRPRRDRRLDRHRDRRRARARRPWRRGFRRRPPAGRPACRGRPRHPVVSGGFGLVLRTRQAVGAAAP